MGSSQSRASERVVEGLKEKVRVLQAEIKEIMRVREGEKQVYERELMVFAFKQAEWKRERKKLKDDAKRLLMLRKQHIRGGSCINLEQEQSKRDETVEEKWKQLYFAIKHELDHLIQTTHHQEEILCWKRVEEQVLEEVKKELISKEEKIQVLVAKIGSMENQELKREREMDILRQSLRIMSHRKISTGQRSNIQGTC